MPNFEVYQRQHSGSRRRRGATVTVTRSGMSFSEDAYAALGSPKAVKFLVDKDPQARVVGFRACERGEPNAHSVAPSGRSVSAVALLKYLKYDARVSRRYTLKVEDGLPPYIDLNEDAPVVTSNRSRRKTSALQAAAGTVASQEERGVIVVAPGAFTVSTGDSDA